MTQTLAIVGATGYIGRHLIDSLANDGDVRIKVLARTPQGEGRDPRWPTGVEAVPGDLNDAESMRGLLEPGCTVVNLVYLWDAGEQANLEAIRNLLDACRAARIGRLIHCSTAAVSGRVADDRITEETACRPVTEYGMTKLKVEQTILASAKDRFDAAILRPTAVFGPGAEPLKKLAADLLHGSRWRNYLKSCLFGRRRMNLVHIGNVVAALGYLIRYEGPVGNKVFIVSDDADPSNNFADVERYLIGALGVPSHPLPRLPLPLGLLSLLLRTLGRNNINPRCNYSQNKLETFGFKSPVDFETGLANYAAWRRAQPDSRS
ncbi:MULTISPECIES: NAD-dependent epimerase/dehydratase family protein [Methylomicrobium]|uniref:Nucleoside-diphosphate-sugar epimerase n=1 Tax=Methylomicrobium album BG8 TaxID=686340 RepID=H8GPA1_METAL|nr:MULTISPECIES: NAD(P)-dependent oxidoreductase [Methylomicrobium]EIC29687.1 nucleoside-diphosphate-sugar epimerase [Methylomicrobium album BG8]